MFLEHFETWLVELTELSHWKWTIPISLTYWLHGWCTFNTFAEAVLFRLEFLFLRPGWIALLRFRLFCLAIWNSANMLFNWILANLIRLLDNFFFFLEIKNTLIFLGKVWFKLLNLLLFLVDLCRQFLLKTVNFMLGLFLYFVFFTFSIRLAFLIRLVHSCKIKFNA